MQDVADTAEEFEPHAQLHTRRDQAKAKVKQTAAQNMLDCCPSSD
jgi:hypothetical protein